MVLLIATGASTRPVDSVPNRDPELYSFALGSVWAALAGSA